MSSGRKSSALQEWVRRTIEGGDFDASEVPEGLDPALHATLAPLIASHQSQQARLVDLDSYLTDLSMVFLEYSAGNFDVSVRMRGEDHTDAVGLGLNMMVEELQAITHQLSVARDQALSANAAKSTFLANMSHELRTPLNAIIGYGELIRDDLPDDPAEDELTQDVDKILKAARHLLRLISDVLDLSKIEAGKMELALETISVAQLINDVADTLGPTIEAAGNVFTLLLDDAPVGGVTTDGMKLRQTLMNLLGNAAKFTANGRVTMRVRHDPPGLPAQPGPGRHMYFDVSDTGLGISPERLEAIFDPFTQERADTARLHGGTGLGLAICARFADLMGGTLSVVSELQKGSTFTLTLPLREAVLTPLPALPRSAFPAEAMVLVVDDDPTAHDLMRRHVSALGFETVLASSGEEALKLARAIRPALITLDVAMPDMDGWTTLAKLKADPILCQIPVVMITIHDDSKRAFALGADDYLTKPVERRRLLQVVVKHVGSKPRRILVVDDEADAREVASRMLASAGFTVSLAKDGVEALSAVAKDPPDMILLDLMMPRMDGFEVVNRLTQDPDFNIPIVILTAKQVDEAERLQLERGAQSILTKGRDLDVVLARMTDILTGTTTR